MKREDELFDLAELQRKENEYIFMIFIPEKGEDKFLLSSCLNEGGKTLAQGLVNFAFQKNEVPKVLYLAKRLQHLGKFVEYTIEKELSKKAENN